MARISKILKRSELFISLKFYLIRQKTDIRKKIIAGLANSTELVIEH